MSTVTAPARPRPSPWRPADAPLVCVGVREDAPGVKTFFWAPQDGSRVKFHAGQAITLEWSLADGHPVHRTFTIASPPTCAGHIETTVKAQADGTATRDMHARLREGMAVRAFGPGGRFGLAFRPADKVLMIGAGSGATPMMSMLRWVRDRRYRTDIAYVHCASTPRDVLFADELGEIAAACPDIAVTVVVSRVPAGTAWLGPRGRLGRRLLTALVPDARHRETFLCGPPGFMDTVRRALVAEGMDRARIHEETFGARPAPPPPVRAVPPQGWSVMLARSGRRVPVDPQRTLLDNLRSAGVVVPSGCRSGICGTCRVKKTAGAVAMSQNGGLSPKEEAAGLILPCCSYARGEVTLAL